MLNFSFLLINLDHVLGQQQKYIVIEIEGFKF